MASPMRAKAMRPRITSHLKKTAKRTRRAASNCETAKIQRMERSTPELLFRPSIQTSAARAASATTVHFVRSGETATMIPSPAAIQRAKRFRRCLNQPSRPGSTACDDCSVSTRSTVPRWCRDPGTAEAAERASRGIRIATVMEEPVQRRTRSGHVRAKGARRAKLLRFRRAREVVWRQSREVARTLDGGERVDEGLAPLGESFHPVPRVEGGVHVGSRGLPLVVREEGDDQEVLWQVERLQLASITRAELRAVGEEERDVRSDLRGHAVQVLGRKRLGKRLVRKPERRGRVGAAAAEAGGDRDPLLDLHAPARFDPRGS